MENYILIAISVLSVSIWLGVFWDTSSWSATYYLLPYDKQWLFTAWCVSYAFPLAFVGDSWWLRCAVLCVLVVGAAANFRGDRAVDITHKTSAMLTVLFAHLAMIYDFHCWRLSLASLTVAAFFFVFRKNEQGDKWAELVTYVSLITALLQ
jgi:hypothetical protein